MQQSRMEDKPPVGVEARAEDDQNQFLGLSQKNANLRSQVSGRKSDGDTQTGSVSETGAENEDAYPRAFQTEADCVMILPVQRRIVQKQECQSKNSKAVHFSQENFGQKNPKRGTSCSPKSTSCKSPQRRSPRRTARSITRLMTRRTPRNAAASRRIGQITPKREVSQCWRP